MPVSSQRGNSLFLLIYFYFYLILFFSFFLVFFSIFSEQSAHSGVALGWYKLSFFLLSAVGMSSMSIKYCLTSDRNATYGYNAPFNLSHEAILVTDLMSIHMSPCHGQSNTI